MTVLGLKPVADRLQVSTSKLRYFLSRDGVVPYRKADLGGGKHLRGIGRGDQIVQVVVKTPRHLSKRQKELLREFAELGEPEMGAQKKRWTFFSEKKE